MTNNKFIQNFDSILKKYGFLMVLNNGEFTINVDHLLLKKILYFLRDFEGCLFKMLIDIFVTDYPGKSKRFVLTYCLLSLKYNIRLKVRTVISEFDSVPSVVDVYKSSCWLEREVWDMNGIFFENHPDLRRILTDYGFEGYPLRKDFPLSGYTETRYDDSQKRVLLEPIEMSQEQRVFNYKSSWE
jgi:NADH-quinone oxidoreductase subunit C